MRAKPASPPRALAVARQQRTKSWELRAAMSMARLWRDQGKRRPSVRSPLHARDCRDNCDRPSRARTARCWLGGNTKAPASPAFGHFNFHSLSAAISSGASGTVRVPASVSGGPISFQRSARWRTLAREDSRRRRGQSNAGSRWRVLAHDSAPAVLKFELQRQCALAGKIRQVKHGAHADLATSRGLIVGAGMSAPPGRWRELTNTPATSRASPVQGDVRRGRGNRRSRRRAAISCALRWRCPRP